MKTLEFSISDEAFELLKELSKSPLRYKDAEWTSLEDFKKSKIFLEEVRDEEWFLSRNCGGTLYLIDELGHYGLVECDTDSWDMTYILTPFGKEISQNLTRVSNLKTLGI